MGGNAEEKEEKEEDSIFCNKSEHILNVGEKISQWYLSKQRRYETTFVEVGGPSDFTIYLKPVHTNKNVISVENWKLLVWNCSAILSLLSPWVSQTSVY